MPIRSRKVTISLQGTNFLKIQSSDTVFSDDSLAFDVELDVVAVYDDDELYDYKYVEC